MEAKNIMLVAPNTVKGAGYLQNNVSDDTLGTAIREAQEVHLASIIGRRLLERLKELVLAKVDNEPDNIDADKNACYKTLLDDYVQPYLIAKVQSVICMPITWKTRNMGVIQGSDTNLNAQYMENVAKVANRYQTEALQKATRMSKWLCKNRGCFEDELNAECGCGEEEPMIGVTFINVPLNLGRGKKNCCK